MAHQEVSPLETASIHLELTTISSPYSLLTGPLRKPRSVAPRYTSPGPGSDAWVAVHRSTAIPIGARPIRQPQMPAIENRITLRRGVDEAGQRNMDALNQIAFSNLQSQRTLTPQSPTPLMQLPTIENLRPLPRDNKVAQGAVHSLDRVAIPYILNPAPTAQRSAALPAALIGDLLAAQPLTVGQSTMLAPSVVRPASPEQHISGALHADAAGLESCPASSTSAAESAPILSQIPLADQVTTGSDMQAQRSQNSFIANIVPSASRADNSPGNGADTLPTPTTSPANSPHRKSESSSDTDSDATTACADAPSAPNDNLNALLVARAEKTLKRKLDAEQVILQASGSSKPSSLEPDSDSKLNSPSTKLVRNPITGKFRRRNMMDDFPDCTEKKLIQ